jgi:hypothetical protein
VIVSRLAIGVIAVAFLSSQTDQKRVVEPVGTAPVEYFETHCKRCHGSEGWGYPDGFASKLSDEALRKELRSMAAGEGGAPLKEADIDVQLAYHRAMSAKAPFIVWTKANGQTLEGEASTESHLTALAGGKVVPIEFENGRWQVTLPAGRKPEEVRIEAVMGKLKSTMELKKLPYSTQKPEHVK